MCQLSKQKLLEVGVEILKKKKRRWGHKRSVKHRGRKTHFCFKCLDDAAVLTELEMKYPRRTVGKKAFTSDLYVQHMLFVYSLQMKGARVASLVMHWLGKRRVLVCILERSVRYRVKDPTRPLTGGWAHCSGHRIRLRFYRSKSPGSGNPVKIPSPKLVSHMDRGFKNRERHAAFN